MNHKHIISIKIIKRTNIEQIEKIVLICQIKLKMLQTKYYIVIGI